MAQVHPVKINLLAYDCEVRRNNVQYKLPPHHNFGECTEGESPLTTLHRNDAIERIATEKAAVIEPVPTEAAVAIYTPPSTISGTLIRDTAIQSGYSIGIYSEDSMALLCLRMRRMDLERI